MRPLVIGLVLLVLGANLLVCGASGLAALFGTSSPEMVVSVSVAMSNRADIALGNLVGSNIFNILGILGLSSILAPLLACRSGAGRVGCFWRITWPTRCT